MAGENGTDATIPQDQAVTGNTEVADPKGKGKALDTENPPQDTAMDEDEDDDEDEDEDEEAEGGAEEEDNMAEIDLDNVIGRRTRGKVIDFAKAAEENPVADDEDEEDDDDFDGDEAKGDDDRMDED